MPQGAGCRLESPVQLRGDPFGLSFVTERREDPEWITLPPSQENSVKRSPIGLGHDGDAGLQDLPGFGYPGSLEPKQRL